MFDMDDMKTLAAFVAIISGAITWLVLLVMFVEHVNAAREFIEVLIQILLEEV